MLSDIKNKIIQVLLEKKILKENDLEKAIAIQKKEGGLLSEILVNSNFVSKGDFVLTLSRELGIPPIDLNKYKIDPHVLKIIPEKTVKLYLIMPISRIGDTVTVAMADPLNVFALDDIKTLTGFKINTVITSVEDIKQAIARYYEEDISSAIEKIIEGAKDEALEMSILKSPQGEFVLSTFDLIRMTQDAPVVKITNMILGEAVSLRASDVLIEPSEETIRVRFRVDGVLQTGKSPPKTLHNAIISRLKVMSNLNIAERRLPQDGRFKAKINGREIDFRISVLPSSRGEKVALRILDKSQAMLDLDSLGFDFKSLENIKRASSKPHGMILMCGPTGCGKTTTLYSVLTHINSPEDNVVTVEDPVEYVIEGFNQVAVRPDIGLTFAGALRSILRQDPDIIMVGEIRDFDTVDIAIKSALTGHLVLSTLHTTTATGSIVRLLNMGVEPFLITSSIILVGAQRLVRKICPNCKEPVSVKESYLKQLDIKFDKAKSIYRGKGCNICLGTGYRGRVGLIETLTLTTPIKRLILEGAQEHKIRELARKEGMATLRENGIQKITEGITTLDEVLRVTVGDQTVGEV